MAEVFANPLVDLAEYTDMKQDMDKGKGPVQVSGVTDSQKVHVMHELSKDNPWRLVVTYDDTRAKEIFDDFSYFEPNTWLYPARDLLFYSSDIHGNLLTRQRMQVFKHLLEDEGGVVVTTVDGLMDHLLPLSRIDPADGRGYDLSGGGADPHEERYRRGNFVPGSRREKAGKSVPGPEKAGGGTADPAGCRGACRILKRGH